MIVLTLKTVNAMPSSFCYILTHPAVLFGMGCSSPFPGVEGTPFTYITHTIPYGIESIVRHFVCYVLFWYLLYFHTMLLALREVFLISLFTNHYTYISLTTIMAIAFLCFLLSLSFFSVSFPSHRKRDTYTLMLTRLDHVFPTLFALFCLSYW